MAMERTLSWELKAIQQMQSHIYYIQVFITMAIASRQMGKYTRIKWRWMPIVCISTWTLYGHFLLKGIRLTSAWIVREKKREIDNNSNRMCQHSIDCLEHYYDGFRSNPFLWNFYSSLLTVHYRRFFSTRIKVSLEKAAPCFKSYFIEIASLSITYNIWYVCAIFYA